MPNCGSVLPNGCALRHSRNVSHCPAAPRPESRPMTSGIPIMAIRRSGSTRGAVALQGVLVRRGRGVDRAGAVGDVEAGADDRGREERRRRRRAATLAPSSVRKTRRKSTESNQSTSVQNCAISDAAMPTTTRISSVVTRGLRRRSRVAVRCPPPDPLPRPAASGSSPNQSRSLTSRARSVCSRQACLPAAR